MQHTDVRLNSRRRHVQVQGHVVWHKSVDQHGDFWDLRAARAHVGKHVARPRHCCQRCEE